jgi:hypothetical protein
MPKRQAKPINYESLESRDLVWLVQVDQDAAAYEHLLTRKEDVIRRLVRNCIRKYTFVDGDDMYQSLALYFPKIVSRYRPGKANTDWDKYCYHRLTYTIKDILRQRDDLGIMWPQKKMYPDWFHLYDKSESSDGCHADVIADHRESIDDLEEIIDFREVFRELREQLAQSRDQSRNPSPGKPAVHTDRPSAWTQRDAEDGGAAKYYWSPVQPKRKLARVTGFSQWRVERSKPKQVMLFK